MDIEKPKVQQVDSDGEGTSSPPHKKTRNPTFDPLKELIGKSQTFLNSNFVFYYKVRGAGKGRFKFLLELKLRFAAPYASVPLNTDLFLIAMHRMLDFSILRRSGKSFRRRCTENFQRHSELRLLRAPATSYMPSCRNCSAATLLAFMN